MKNYQIVVLGYALIAPLIIVLSGNVVVTICGLLYGIVLFNMPTLFPKTRVFWCKFHKILIKGGL